MFTSPLMFHTLLLFDFHHLVSHHTTPCHGIHSLYPPPTLVISPDSFEINDVTILKPTEIINIILYKRIELVWWSDGRIFKMTNSSCCCTICNLRLVDAALCNVHAIGVAAVVYELCVFHNGHHSNIPFGTLTICIMNGSVFKSILLIKMQWPKRCKVNCVHRLPSIKWMRFESNRTSQCKFALCTDFEV